MANKPKSADTDPKPADAATEGESPEQPARTVLDQVQITNQQITHTFEYHKPDAEQQGQIDRIRAACMACAQVIKDNTPGSADQTAAIRKISEGMMTANKAVVCKGR